MGLPYVSDPAVTRHLAAFLQRQLKADERPDAILFNGGVFQPQALRDRLIEVMRPWYGPELASAGLGQSVARSGGRLGSGLFRLAAAQRRQTHRRRHCAILLHRRR